MALEIASFMLPRRLAVMAALAIGLATSAEARIACINGNQIVNGVPLATPYCQDELVAAVARQHGMKVSADRVRANPNTKREVCRLVGHDIRIYQACIDTNSVGRRPW